MGRFASEKLLEAMEILDTHEGNSVLPNVFNKVWDDFSGQSAQLGILYLFNDLRSEIELARLSERSKSRNLSKADKLASDFLQGMNNTNWDGFRSKFSVPHAINELENITDVLETSGFPRSENLNRENLSLATGELVFALGEMGLPEEVMKLALIKLKSVERLVEIKSVSDSQIAEKVKSVVADLLVALDPYASNQPSLKNKIISWGKTGTHATAFALGLLADGSAVASLLTTDEPPRQIAAPLKQIVSSSEKDTD